MASNTTEEERKGINRWKTATIEFCSETTAHGFGRLVHSQSRILRWMWLCLVIAGAIGCIYETSEFVYRFLEFGVTVKFTRVREKSLQFPAITLCNLNRFRRSKVGTEIGNITVNI